MMDGRSRNDGERIPRSGRRIAVLLCAVAPLVAAAPAQAVVVYELSPTASVGVTSNAQANSTGSASAVSTLAALARVRSEGLRVTNSLAARIGYTRYLVEGAQDSLSGELLGTSTIEISQPLTLSLSAAAVLSRTSNVGTTNVPGQAALPGSDLYLASSANEGLGYAATQRLRLGQGFSASRIDYLTSSFSQSAVGRPSTTLTPDLRADYSWTRDTLSLDARGTYLIADAGTDAMGMPIPSTNALLLEGLAGWRRELTLSWSASLQAGMAWVRQSSGSTASVPVAIASVDYRHLPWYTTLTVQHAPVVNLFLGTVSVNDQASLYLTLPLDRSELIVLSGFASYARARAADEGDAVATSFNYDQLSAGGILSKRFRQLPLFGSILYSVIDQHGTSTGGQALEIVRHTVMINLTAAFQWGPGTPAILGGGFI